MTDHITDFIAAMRDDGVEVADGSEVKADGKVNRLHMSGDRRGAPSISYQLTDDGDFAFAWYVAWKVSPDSVAWHSKTQRGRTDEQREQAKAWAEARRAEQEAARAEARAQGQARIRELVAGSWPCEEHPYLARKGVAACDGLLADCDDLLVPMYRAPGEVCGAQRIGQGGKKFLPASETSGAWFKVAGGDTIAVCEGLATALTVHAATGWTVYVAFSAGNMEAVARYAHNANPDARMIIAGDNDLWTFDSRKIPKGIDPGAVAGDDPQWTEWRDAGLLRNAGHDSAGKAGQAVLAQVVLPPFTGNEAGKPTDWNDYASAHGVDAARALLMGVPEPQPMAEPEYENYVPDYEPEPDMGGEYKLASIVNPLGYDEEVYYFLPRKKGQIIKITASGLASANNLFQLATPDEYRSIAGDWNMKQSEMVSNFAPLLMDMCHGKGVYEPEKVMGAGAWRVGDGVYVNTGRDVYDCATGVSRPHSEMMDVGVFVKDRRAYDLDAPPLTNAQANKLIQITSRLSWKRSISGVLLAGWCVIAPFGGALGWRPHVFVTGQKGSGKSTVMDNIVEPMLGLSVIRQDGGSTEAGLRKSVGSGSGPLLMDEFEGEIKRDAENVQKILFWARKAASGGMIVNANGAYRARSCVCFSAIIPLIIQGADADRITVLDLVTNTSADAESAYDEILEMIHSTITPKYVRGMMRRTADNFGALAKNIDVFSRVASRVLGSKRAGDQIGPMLAGAYMLHSTRALSLAEAEKWCEKQDWSWHDDQNEGTDADAIMQYLLGSMVEHTAMDRTNKVPVAALVARVKSGEMGHEDAAKTLGRYGMAVDGDRLLVANKCLALSRIFDGTAWSVYKPALGRYPGATTGGPRYFFTGLTQRFTSIPLNGLMGVVHSANDEIEDW